MVVWFVGVINLREIQALEDITTPHGKWWVPMVWSCNLVKKAKRDGLIADTYSMKAIIDVSARCHSYLWLKSHYIYKIKQICLKKYYVDKSHFCSTTASYTS